MIGEVPHPFLLIHIPKTAGTSVENHWSSCNETVAQWRKSLARDAIARGITWHSASTDESIVSVMRQWLHASL